MYKFFVSKDAVGTDVITIIGEDVNHIKNVLRLKEGEEFYVSTGDDREYLCSLQQANEDCVIARILDVYGSNRELSAKITLFQALPKGDKMETIIQKAVELGVYEVIPVTSSRVIVKLDEKKKKKKIERWNSIAKAAAKQSKRNYIPKVCGVMDFKAALELSKSMDKAIIPYENAKGMNHARKVIKQMKTAEKIGVFVGAEGGFSEEEIALAMQANVEPITLGHRILRTETAGITVLSIIMFALEQDESEDKA